MSVPQVTSPLIGPECLALSQHLCLYSGPGGCRLQSGWRAPAVTLLSTGRPWDHRAACKSQRQGFPPVALASPVQGSPDSRVLSAALAVSCAAGLGTTQGAADRAPRTSARRLVRAFPKTVLRTPNLRLHRGRQCFQRCANSLPPPRQSVKGQIESAVKPRSDFHECVPSRFLRNESEKQCRCSVAGSRTWWWSARRMGEALLPACCPGEWNCCLRGPRPTSSR